MKELTPKSLRFIPAALGLLICLLANHAGAGIDTWDPQGTVTTATGGTWENASWDTANQTGTATPVHFVQGDAVSFAYGNQGGSASTFTVTMNSSHTVAGLFNGPLTPKSCYLTISGSGHIVLPTSGPQGFSTGGSTPGQTTINVIIDGPSTCALEPEGAGQLFLNGANTFSGGLDIATGAVLVNFNNASSFGSGTITLASSGGRSEEHTSELQSP